MLLRKLVLGSAITLFALQNAFASAVATSSPYATDAATQILKTGGNAVDAACAAGFALNVTQPYFSGIGGGGFATLQDKTGQRIFFNFREQSPSVTNKKWFYDTKGKVIDSWSQRNTGPVAVGIPGFVSGCGEMHKKYGHLSWQQVIAPAIKLARDGFTISQMYQEEQADQWARISKVELTKSIFQGTSGEGLKKDEVLKQPLLATTLETIAANGPQSFYTGALAKSWIHQAQTLGVNITEKDLKNYQTRQEKPVHFTFGKITGETAALPSSAGIMVASTLRFLDSYYRKNGLAEPNPTRRYIVDIEAMSYFASLRDKNLADPAKSKINTAHFIDSASEAKAFLEINKRIEKRLAALNKEMPAANSLQKEKTKGSNPNHEIHTQHTNNISVIDDGGMAIALTNSVGNVYGSSLTVPEHGFVLNSTLGDFDAESNSQNAPGPGLRPRSNMSPTLLYVTKEGKQELIAVVGAAGGSIIPTSVVLFIENVYMHKMDPKDALAAARVHPNDGSKVDVEKKIPQSVVDDLKAAGYEVNSTETIWAILEAVVRPDLNQPWVAVSDGRYDGKATVIQ